MALILLVLKITGKGVAVGLVTACEFGPVLLLSAWGGAIADRSDKRKLLFLTQALEMAQSAGLAALAFTAHPPLWGLYGLTVIGGALLAFDNPLRRAFVTEMVPADDIPNAVVLYSTIVNLSRVFGPALAGLLIATVGFGWSFTLDTASYSAVLLCLALMRAADLRRVPPRPRARGEIIDGLRYVASQPRLWISLAMFVAIGIFTYNFTVTLPLFVKDVLHGSTRVFTLLYAIFSTGSVIGALVVAHRRWVGMTAILLGAFAMGVTTLAFAATSGVWTAAIMVFLLGLGEHPLYHLDDGDHPGRGAARHARAAACAADGRDGGNERAWRPAARRHCRCVRRPGADFAGRCREPAHCSIGLLREPPRRCRQSLVLSR